MVVDDPLGDITLTYDGILERVDEYSLYCHYLGYDPIPDTGVYNSPVRTDDDNPSFGIYYTRRSTDREFLWKDQATGVSGDIYKLVMLMFQLNSRDSARKKIAKDMGLATEDAPIGDRILRQKPPVSFTSDIRVKSRSFTKDEVKYWSDINISTTVLTNFNVTALSLYWLSKDQVAPTIAKEFTFGYRVWDKYKIYQPFAAKEYKFRNNFSETYLEGLEQLTFTHDLLVITKSLKDVMFLYTLGYEAIAPHSETSMISQRILDALQKKYKRIVTLFDNDGKHKAKEYPYPELHIPIEIGHKDPTDVARYRSIDEAVRSVNKLLKSYV